MRAFIRRSPPGTIGSIVQQRGTRWLRLTVPDREGADLAELLSDVEISETGTISTTSTTRTVFASVTWTAGPEASTGFTATTPEGAFLIETSSFPDPVAVFGTIGDRVEQIAIGDRQGWLMSQRTEPGLTPYAIAWSATPRRVIAVGSTSDEATDVDDLLRLAQQLQIVDEATWRAALPDATTEILRESPSP